MAQAKKYGAFAGVFTPSILTILGVIMYMRLPWITGQSGLFMVIGIVLVAHIVSICTGVERLFHCNCQTTFLPFIFAGDSNSWGINFR